MLQHHQILNQQDNTLENNLIRVSTGRAIKTDPKANVDVKQ